MGITSFLAENALDVTTALATGKTVVGWVLGVITENPILTAVFVLGTLIPAGVAAFRNLKHAA